MRKTIDDVLDRGQKLDGRRLGARLYIGACLTTYVVLCTCIHSLCVRYELSPSSSSSSFSYTLVHVMHAGNKD
jgi:hypothetical protein